MKVAPDYLLIRTMKQRLKCITNISFETHAEKRAVGRNIDKEEIKQILKNHAHLMLAIPQEDLKGEKYKLVFRKSGRYDFIIVVRFKNSKLKIITLHKQDNKRIRVVEKWRKHLIRERLRRD